jgi:heavy metal sensor kinase
MRLFKTLRFRFALWIAGLLLIVLIAFGAFVYISLAQSLYASIDDSLRLSASQAIAAVNIENGAINFSDSIPESSASDLRDRGLTIRVLSTSGQVLQSFGPYRALPVDPMSLQAAQQRQSTFASLAVLTTTETIRFYTAPIVENAQIIGIVQVAQSLADAQHTLDRLLAALLIGGPLLALAAAFGGYFLAARALTPIDHITRTARHIAEADEDLSTRLNLPATDDEVGRLASTFDLMLTRLDDSFRRERQFTTDASHELRTPLAAMQAILSVVREERRTSEDYELALSDLAEETDRLRALTENLLRLARDNGSQPALRESVDLSQLVCNVAESMRPLAEAKGLELNCTVPAGLSLIGDTDDLIRLFVNLLGNAINYTDQGGVDLTGFEDSAGLHIAIRDTGIGIPAEHLPHIFDRFYRVDASRASSGSGLGLAIALSIARAHGGTITARSAANVGTTFAVEFPSQTK